MESLAKSSATEIASRGVQFNHDPVMITGRRNPYTQRAIERAIKAAMSAGLRVVGVKPDGTVLTDGKETYTDIAGVAPHPTLTGKPRLRDAREKLGAT